MTSPSPDTLAAMQPFETEAWAAPHPMHGGLPFVDRRILTDLARRADGAVAKLRAEAAEARLAALTEAAATIEAFFEAGHGRPIEWGNTRDEAFDAGWDAVYAPLLAAIEALPLAASGSVSEPEWDGYDDGPLIDPEEKP